MGSGFQYARMAGGMSTGSWQDIYLYGSGWDIPKVDPDGCYVVAAANDVEENSFRVGEYRNC
jgi:hypothetical protein